MRRSQRGIVRKGVVNDAFERQHFLRDGWGG
jgi:hypothetical protein